MTCDSEQLSTCQLNLTLDENNKYFDYTHYSVESLESVNVCVAETLY